MNCLLVIATVSGVAWALIQGIVPLFIDILITYPTDLGVEAKKKIRCKRILAWVSIVVITAILIITIIGFVMKYK